MGGWEGVGAGRVVVLRGGSSPTHPPHPAQTNFKTQVEADIQPFRGILLGLFFVTTGSSLDVGLLLAQVLIGSCWGGVGGWGRLSCL